ncbi:MAG: GNAT family N-acetyltransferase [Pseudomonadota bacterium]
MIEIRTATGHDRPWIATASESIGGPLIVTDSQLVDVSDHPALVASVQGERLGFLVYRNLAPDVLEVIALRALQRRIGIGSALLDDLMARARAITARQIELDTTNDNAGGLAFYERHGFVVEKHRRGAFAEVLALKGYTIDGPVIGCGGREITDVIRLRKILTDTGFRPAGGRA